MSNMRLDCTLHLHSYPKIMITQSRKSLNIKPANIFNKVAQKAKANY